MRLCIRPARRPRCQTRRRRRLESLLERNQPEWRLPVGAWRAKAAEAALLPEDVEAEEEAADLAAARSCPGSPTSIMSESQIQGAVILKSGSKIWHLPALRRPISGRCFFLACPRRTTRPIASQHKGNGCKSLAVLHQPRRPLGRRTLSFEAISVGRSPWRQGQRSSAQQAQRQTCDTNRRIRPIFVNKM